ncbi:MAG TPA: AraC family transcriptional regulator [Glycomyces sp.]|nr:AraC family transcriptional regulator [Glycomyces sp.]
MPEVSTYEERPVRGALAAWSPCAWVRAAPATGVAETRVVPDGCLDLLWRAGGLEIAGPDTAHREVPLAPGECIVGVRLRPGAARPLLGETPATEVVNAQPALNDLWGREARRLEDRLSVETDPWRIAGALAGALGSRASIHGPDAVAVAVADALDRPRPPAIASLAWEMGYSERQLRRRVLAAAGYGPKTLEQILRFRRSLEASGRGADWSRIAAEQGYADQAHLSRQMRRWSGASPRTVTAQTA